MAIQNATNVAIRVGGQGAGNTIGYATSASLSINIDLRDSTTKSSLGWQENLGGLKSWEISGDAFVDVDNDTFTGNDPFIDGSPTDSTLKNIGSLWTTWLAGDAVVVAFGNDTKEWYGNAIITSISIDTGVEENATYSISLTGTGALTEA